MKKIRLITSKNGVVRLDRLARPRTTLEEVVEIAEFEVNEGVQAKARVEVDGEIYCEYEA